MHGHGHAHHPDAHDHGHPHAHGSGDERRLLWSLALIGGFMLVEVAGGLLTGSLALLADAGHMLTDSGALALSWWAMRMTKRPPDLRRSYGYHRVPVLTAFTNGVLLIGVAVWVLVEAAHRLTAPVAVSADGMLAIGAVGLLVNIVAFLILHGGSRENLNLKGAALHVLADLLGSVAAVAGALVILATGWTPIDPILSAVLAAPILWSALGLIRRSGHILVEGTPEGLDPAQIGAVVRGEVDGVVDVHHVHAWSLAAERTIVTLHAVVSPGADTNAVVARAAEVLRTRFGIAHATIQVEREGYGPCHDGAC